MTQRLRWERDGKHWPHHAHSRFVHAAGLRWHIQYFESQQFDSSLADSILVNAPTALLIHGTGASTHSWRGLAPLLTPHVKVLSLDLPGHAFTDMPPGGSAARLMSLPGMATAIGELLAALDVSPVLLIGHSAGAALAVRMTLDGLAHPRHIVSINGALQPLGGLAGQVFSPVARLMSALPFVPSLFAWQATHPSVLQKLIDSTGSRLDAEGMALYGQLVSNPGHAAGALGMMANWDLPQLAMDLPRLSVPLSLIVGSQDHTVPPRQAERLRAFWPTSSVAAAPQLVTLPGLGHLAHEEQPELVARHVLAQFKSHGAG